MTYEHGTHDFVERTAGGPLQRVRIRLATRFTLRYELRLSIPRSLSRRKESVQLGCDEFRKRSFARLEQRHDRRALRFDVPPENFARDAAEVDAEVFDLRSVGNRKIG